MINQQKFHNLIYCTIFDDNYLARALALYESLIQVNGTALFVFFCIDANSVRLLNALKLNRSLVVSHEEFATPELLQGKPFRSRGEYCWTCKPVALLHLMRCMPEASWVAYVDTDMMFFADPDLALPGPESHYLLAPHRYHPAFSEYEKSAGKHNAGYVAARNSSEGKSVITWWKDRCIESCSVIPSDTAFADQKYLDQFSELFPFGVSADHKGLNVAPWNVENFNVANGVDGIQVDEQPLLLYHFQGLQLFDNGTASLYIGDMRIRDVLRTEIYQPYLLALLRAFARIRAVDPAFASGLGKQRKYLGNTLTRAFKALAKSGNVVPFQVT